MLWWIIWGDQPAIFSNFTPVTHCRVDVTMTHHIYLFFTVSTIVIVQIWGLLTFNRFCPIIFPCVRRWQPILWPLSIFQPAWRSLSSWITVDTLKANITNIPMKPKTYSFEWQYYIRVFKFTVHVLYFVIILLFVIVPCVFCNHSWGVAQVVKLNDS